MSPKAGSGKGSKTKKAKKSKAAVSKKAAATKHGKKNTEQAKPADKPGGLPPSGLAEDILGALEEETGETKDKTSALPAYGLAADVLGSKEEQTEQTASEPPERLPTYGLAEDILGAQEPETAKAPADFEARDPGKADDPADAEEEDAEYFDETPSQVVAFVIADEEYALQISEVLEVTHVGEITRVPNAKEYIRGVVNLRGKIIPIIDLKKRFDVGTVEITKSSRVIVVEYGESSMGLLVDRVSQVYRPALDDIEEPPEEVTSAKQNCVRGVFSPAPKQLVFLLDLYRTLFVGDTSAAE